jgi:Tfp pilus assembly protein PilO
MEQTTNFNRYYVRIVKIWERPTIRRFSAAGATLFLIAFFILAALKPTIETILTLNKKITDARDTEAQMTSKIAAINEAINTYQNYKNDIAILDGYLPDSPNADKLINMLNTDLQKSSINNGTYTLSSFTLATESGKISINLSATNEYPNIVNLLTNLVNANQLVTLNSLSIFKSKNDSTLDFSVTGKSYYEKK